MNTLIYIIETDIWTYRYIHISVLYINSTLVAHGLFTKEKPSSTR